MIHYLLFIGLALLSLNSSAGTNDQKTKILLGHGSLEERIASQTNYRALVETLDIVPVSHLAVQKAGNSCNAGKIESEWKENPNHFARIGDYVICEPSMMHRIQVDVIKDMVDISSQFRDAFSLGAMQAFIGFNDLTVARYDESTNKIIPGLPQETETLLQGYATLVAVQRYRTFLTQIAAQREFAPQEPSIFKQVIEQKAVEQKQSQGFGQATLDWAKKRYIALTQKN